MEQPVLVDGGLETRLAQLEESLQRDPADHRTLHNLGAVCYKLGRFEDALAYLDRAVKARPRGALTHYLLGLVLKDSDRLAAAIEQFSEALALDDEYREALFHRGTSYLSIGDTQKCIEDLTNAAAAGLEASHLYHNLAIAHSSAGNWMDAARALARCVELDPANAAAYHHLLAETGRAQAYEEMHFGGHRIKNLVGLAAEKLRAVCAPVEQEFDEEERKSLSAVRQDLDRVYDEMTSYLRLMRPEPDELDLVRPVQLVERALFAASARLTQIRVEKDLADDLPELVCQVDQMQEALLNIILNAADAMSEGGALRVAVSGAPDAVLMSFEDTGSGVPAEMRRRIFRPGVTTKREGTGLGLTQAQRAIARHGGRLELEDTDAGTRIRISLPTSPAVSPELPQLGPRSTLAEDLSELIIS